MYSQLRAVIRGNDIDMVDSMWAICWGLFQASHKPLYARLTLYVQHVLKHIHPGMRFVNAIYQILTKC